MLLLVALIVLFVPLIIWPSMLDGPYRVLTKAMARMFARNIVGKSRPKAGMTTELVIIPLSDTPGLVPPTRRVSMLRWIMEEAGGGHYYPSNSQEAHEVDRAQMINDLINQADMADAEYIRGNMDRDTWSKSLAEIDDKLSILGLRFAFRPWESAATAARF